jgi:hypothetical protein
VIFIAILSRIREFLFHRDRLFQTSANVPNRLGLLRVAEWGREASISKRTVACDPNVNEETPPTERARAILQVRF